MGAEPMGEGDLARMVDIGEARIMYHLKVLRDAGLVIQADEAQEEERAYLAVGMAGR